MKLQVSVPWRQLIKYDGKFVVGSVFHNLNTVKVKDYQFEYTPITNSSSTPHICSEVAKQFHGPHTVSIIMIRAAELPT